MISVLNAQFSEIGMLVNANSELRHAMFTPLLAEAGSKTLRLDLKSIGGSTELRSKQLPSAPGEKDWLQRAAEATTNASTSFTPRRVQA